jgi:hypothetical protein
MNVLPGRVGRPSAIWDDAKLDQFEAMLQEGVHPSTAFIAAGLGLHEATYFRWLTEGLTALRREEEGLPLDASERRYRDFRERTTVAIAQAEALWTAQARQQALLTSAPTTLDMLARRFPSHWKRVDGLEISGPDGMPIAIDEAGTLSDDELEARIARLERIAGR